jgi:uncharacterized membrane protein
VHGIVGPVLASATAGILTVIDAVSGDSWPTLMTVAWVLDAAYAVLAALYLVLTAVAWLVYRRRRAHLDAAGAEVVGEPLARIANRQPS